MAYKSKSLFVLQNYDLITIYHLYVDSLFKFIYNGFGKSRLYFAVT